MIPLHDFPAIDAALNAIRSAFERIEQFATRALIDDDDEPTTPTPDWKQIAVRPLLRSIKGALAPG